MTKKMGPSHEEVDAWQATGDLQVQQTIHRSYK